MEQTYRDGFSDPSSGWRTYGYEDGRFAIHIDSSSSFYEFHTWEAIGKIEEGLLQVDVLGPFRENDRARRGLGFGSRYGNSTGAYAFTISSAGICEFLEYGEVHDSAGWIIRETGNVLGFDGQNGFYTLQVYISNYREAIGYVNDRFCAKYTMRHYSAGYVGIIASASYYGLDYHGGDSYFDEFQVFLP